MNDSEEALGAVKALLEYSNALHARLTSLEVLTDAMVRTIGKSLPPLLPVLQINLFALADVRERDLEPALRQSFRAHIAHIDRKIEAAK
jgi:hypothetical protein